MLAECLLQMLPLLFTLHRYKWLLLKNCLLNLLRFMVPVIVFMNTDLFYLPRWKELVRHRVIGAVLRFIGSEIRNVLVCFRSDLSACLRLRPIA